jgi:hypothetical protein
MNFLAELFIKVFCHFVTQYLLNAKVFWKFVNPIRTRVFLIILWVFSFETILLVGVVLEFPKWWGNLGKRSTTHAYCRCIIIVLRGSAEWFLEVRYSITTIINCVILIFVRNLLTRNFLLVIFQKLLIERLLREAPMLFIILLVHLINLICLLNLVYLMLRSLF